MAVRSKAERAKRAETWVAYLAVMAELRASAEGLVVALTRYLRKGGGDYNYCPPPSVLMPAMDAERRYAVALRAAEPYHMSVLPRAPSIVNDDGPALLATLRAVRGDDFHAVTTIVPSADGFERRAVVPRYVSGVADWVDLELRSMAPFGSPRRDPSEGASAKTPAAPTAESFKAQTRKRKFSDPFEEDGSTWIIDADGHQWCWTGEEWEQFTDDDDAFVVEVARSKRTKSNLLAQN